MKPLKFKLVDIFLFLCLYYACVVAEEKIQQAKRTYIVHMDKSNMPESFSHHSLWYDSSLKSVSDSASVLYQYENVVHGYSTMLTAEEADSLGEQPGILSVLPEVVYELHTTRTPEFLGLGKSTAFFPTSDSMAGNSGPTPSSLSNVAPWITTVGAGTLDRDFPASITLGNNEKYSGVTLYSGKQLSDSMVPLVYGGNTSNSSGGNLCMTGSLVPEKVSGKIVVCDRGGNARVQKGVAVKEAGGVGMILTNTDTYGEELVADAHLLPSAAVGQMTGDAIKKYIASAHNPTAIIGPGTTKLGVQPSPVVAAFSSRVAALDPGLVYDATIDDYLGFLCALNYTPNQIKSTTHRDFTCQKSKKYTVGDLNYPSFSVPLDTASGKRGGARVSSTIKYTRALTNVGAPATYKVSLYSQTQAVKMSVEPATLTFGAQYEKKSYTVTFTTSSMPSGTTSFAHLEWSDGKHIVRSPIAFSWT
ncbi:hypothetical protein V6N12_040634 [Hibiscus sabdariffa]|uniref:Subtilisin-like protease n=1 Tax=Hibiscus sabdariffa TaxID=183260 RepID=A0ABR2E4A0_9ROSI